MTRLGARLLALLLAGLLINAQPAAAHHRRVRVPNVAGMTAAHARHALHKRHLRAVLRGSGFVVSERPRAGRRVRRHARIRLALALPAPPPRPRGPAPIIGVGDVPGCLWGVDPRPVLDLYRTHEHVTVMRVVLPSYDPASRAEPCIAAAAADGFRILLIPQWDNSWSPAQIGDYFRNVLAVLGRYAWAVGIGNEQDLCIPGCPPAGESAEQYVAAWRVAEPIVAALTPAAVRVGGELPPWGINFFQRALAEGLPGIQVVAAHPYVTSNGAGPAAFLTMAQSDHLPLWDDEGLNIPVSPYNNVDGNRSAADLAGAALIAAWLIHK